MSNNSMYAAVTERAVYTASITSALKSGVELHHLLEGKSIISAKFLIGYVNLSFLPHFRSIARAGVLEKSTRHLSTSRLYEEIW